MSQSPASSDRPRQIVRVEANVEELPIFSASSGRVEAEVVVWSRRGRDPETGDPIDQSMTLRAAGGITLPATPERDLYYLVISPWIEEHGFGPDGAIGPISFGEACERLGKTRSGNTYRQLRQSIRRLTTLSVEFQHCIIDGETRRLGGVIDKWFTSAFYEESRRKPNKRGTETIYELARGEFMLFAASWFVRSYETNYLKPIDTGVYSRIRGDIAKSLFSYLDKRAWDSRKRRYRDEVVEDIQDLKTRFRLTVRDTKKLLQQFRHAHGELVDKWPRLTDAVTEKVAVGRYNCVYRFTPQQRLAFPEPIGEGGGDETATLAAALVERGVSRDAAKQLVDSHEAESIERHIDIHDEETRLGVRAIRNPGGRLRQRIVGDWAPFDGYVSPAERRREKERHQAELREKRERAAAEEAERAAWDALPVEEKARRSLERWLLIRRNVENREPSDVEKQEKLQELREKFR